MQDDDGQADGPRFKAGQLVHHKLFDYRGVIYKVDPRFQGTEEWYRTVAQSIPPKDAPWYHVLVDGSTHTTYVAERNLEPDPTPGPVQHPLVNQLFTSFTGERYVTALH